MNVINKYINMKSFMVLYRSENNKQTNVELTNTKDDVTQNEQNFVSPSNICTVLVMLCSVQSLFLAILIPVAAVVNRYKKYSVLGFLYT